MKSIYSQMAILHGGTLKPI